VQEVRHAVSRRAIKSYIDVWRTVGERLACDLYRLRGDRVLRARHPDGEDHHFTLTPDPPDSLDVAASRDDRYYGRRRGRGGANSVLESLDSGTTIARATVEILRLSLGHPWNFPRLRVS
jgi:hypothetical protein